MYGYDSALLTGCSAEPAWANIRLRNDLAILGSSARIPFAGACAVVAMSRRTARRRMSVRAARDMYSYGVYNKTEKPSVSCVACDGSILICANATEGSSTSMLRLMQSRADILEVIQEINDTD
jgi:hypothetical protein